jgi:hypothetical protein
LNAAQDNQEHDVVHFSDFLELQEIAEWLKNAHLAQTGIEIGI